ncbi:YwbE family protein [Bacillus sp. JJ722]|uniref:YwbE family protein n=1 Tax=Bacillus sp. JJ722 TaxID=3122973 RepID=UPI002FFD86C1
MPHTKRSNLSPGMLVDIVLKKDQRTELLTRGTIKRLLTNSSVHHHGIKVELTNGQVGRVKHIIEE